MRPLDPRLLRHASAARRFLAAGAVIGVAHTVVVICGAWLLTRCIVLAVDGRGLTAVSPVIGLLAAAVVARSVLTWLQDLAAARAASEVKRQLRARALDALAAGGPARIAGRHSAHVTTVLTGGLDALDTYFSRYLPQLLLTAIATPLLVAVILWNDPASGVTVILALPLIPVFMVLVGWRTQAAQQEQWLALQRLASGFLDVIGGLATLKIYGREHRQPARLRAITEEYQGRTMGVLRVSFLSGFVLELAASLSVALVAVSIGLRLVDGQLPFATGLFVLLLAPEAFLPLRQVGAQFHAAADGIAAADEVFALLAPAPAPAVAHSRPGVRGNESEGRAEAGVRFEGVRFEGVVVRARVTSEPVTAHVRPGELSVIAGPSGAGKTTLLRALAGFVPFDGRISRNGMPVGQDDTRGWLAWAGQRPQLFSGTVASNVTLGAASVDLPLLQRALALAGIPSIDPARTVGGSASGLSGGQAQRVAVARACYRALANGCDVVALDEPTSALDDEAEAALLRGLRALAQAGRAVIVVSHRPAVLAAADAVVHVGETAARALEAARA
ncbi:thiol reductant ABC exporter subunit CydD [Cryobacterium tepidiphilum]|uniref:Thiol reductant ABC exporter subunit CydD n=1 Tax=Cryobacterium tepidiphilum TaxID=2486026 RepID=A0A3M8L1Q4_9MICO|nr:thiol reductant ABC exporter subunit CydD [Cryobacterium tepidiphilum]RNE59471.1 thiol reductant ABC exporter subunit CydD [Cryobacterium tepidiphilum]